MKRMQPYESIQNEEWRPIPGYEGVYSASSLGRIRREPYIMAASPRNRWGYRLVGLRNNGKGSGYTVHRLVAKAFLGELPKRYNCHHKDGDKENNTLSNLEYITVDRHAKLTLQMGQRNPPPGLRGEASPKSKLTDVQRLEIIQSTERCCALAERYRVHNSTISRIKNGRRWIPAISTR